MQICKPTILQQDSFIPPREANNEERHLKEVVQGAKDSEENTIAGIDHHEHQIHDVLDADRNPRMIPGKLRRSPIGAIPKKQPRRRYLGSWKSSSSAPDTDNSQETREYQRSRSSGPRSRTAKKLELSNLEMDENCPSEDSNNPFRRYRGQGCNCLFRLILEINFCKYWNLKSFDRCCLSNKY